jgi:hypothetical protein
LKALGLSAADAADWLDDDEEVSDDFPVFPDNVDALCIFVALGTQWRVVGGMHGLIYTGLDYSVLPEIWERFAIRKKDRTKVFEQLRIMELAAIPVRNRPAE